MVLTMSRPPALAVTSSTNLQPRPANASNKVALPKSTPIIRSRPTTAAPVPSSSKIPMAPPARPTLTSQTSSSSTSTLASTPSAAPPSASASATTGGGKDTSSSAGTVFAKPTKEWVLPERAKPGRKVSADEPDNKRQSQNRQSQRAHRARRTDYIQTLEERLRAYEADEIHSNVRLQEVARALKADNDKMKAELLALRSSTDGLVGEKEGWELEKKSLEDMCAELMVEVQRLRAGGTGQGMKLESQPHRPARNVVSPRGNKSDSLVRPHPHSQELERQRTVIDCPICPNPDPDCPCQKVQGDENGTNRSMTTNSHALISASSLAPSLGNTSMTLLPSQSHAHQHSSYQDQSLSETGFEHAADCGFCSNTAECLCLAVAQHPSPPLPTSHSLAPPLAPFVQPPKGEKCDICPSLAICLCEDDASPTTSNQSLQVITPPQASVPLALRRKRDGGSGIERQPIWRLDNPSLPATIQKMDTPGVATCSGDPSNCEACKNDPFGKEFCEQLFDPAQAQAQAASQPQSQVQEPQAGPTSVSILKGCADCPGNCMSLHAILGPSVEPNMNSAAGIISSADHETMRCDEAWRTLKAHPNAKFASLALLADVVAGRTKCAGPAISVSSPGADIDGTISTAPNVSHGGAKNVQVKRKMAVEMSAVRDALRLLDETPSRAGSEVEVKVEPYEGVEHHSREVKRQRME